MPKKLEIEYKKLREVGGHRLACLTEMFIEQYTRMKELLDEMVAFPNTSETLVFNGSEEMLRNLVANLLYIESVSNNLLPSLVEAKDKGLDVAESLFETVDGTQAFAERSLRSLFENLNKEKE